MLHVDRGFLGKRLLCHRFGLSSDRHGFASYWLFAAEVVVFYLKVLIEMKFKTQVGRLRPICLIFILLCVICVPGHNN